MSESVTKSPFPGMDPYLERYWREVHARLVVYSCDYLQPRLPKGLHARVEEHIGLTSDDNTLAGSRYPDVQVHGEGVEDVAAPTLRTDVAIAESLHIAFEAPPSLRRFIAIVDSDAEDRLVTAIEVLSPGNKVGTVARERYRQRQEDLVASGANLVELDLVRAGGYVLLAPAELLPDDWASPYRACVYRSCDPSDVTMFRLPLREQLLGIAVPLRPADPEIGLDLQSIVDHIYASGTYGTRIDYTRDPVPPLDPADAAWADELLKSKGLR